MGFNFHRNKNGGNCYQFMFLIIVTLLGIALLNFENSKQNFHTQLII
jgi:SNF family Na+-dependent transporter